MINFFKMAENDLSMTYLYHIFGSMNGLIPTPPSLTNLQSASSSTYNTMTMLGVMFNTFNSVMLAIGALIVVYVTIVGVMATAHEGEFMGKKFNSIWLPIRTVFGIASLIPTSSGYSVIQLIFMWIIIQGIAAADTLWSTTLSARSILGTPYSDATVPDVTSGQAIATLFQGLVCGATANLSYPNPSGGSTGNYYCSDKTCGNSFYEFVSGGTTNDNTITLGPNGVCGKVTYCNPDGEACSNQNSMQCIACKAQNAALAAIVPTLAGIAEQLATSDYTYRNFTATSYNQANNTDWKAIYDFCANQNPAISESQCCVATKLDTPGMSCPTGSGTSLPAVDISSGAQSDAISASDDAVTKLYYPYMMDSGNISNFEQIAADNYSAALQTALKTYIQVSANTPSNLESATIGFPGLGLPAGRIFEQGDRGGWILGGMFYYVIAIEGAPSALAHATPKFDVSLTADELMNYRTNIAAASALMEAAQPATAEKTTTASTAAQVMLSLKSSSLQVPGSNKVIKKLIKPLVKYLLIPAFQVLIAALNDLILLAGGPINGLQVIGFLMMQLSGGLYTGFLLLSIYFAFGMGVMGVMSFGIFAIAMAFAYALVAPVVLAFITWLLVTGALLSIFLPLVPFTIFFFGVIGWFMAVIEAMVAAPLVAIGILSPNAQGHELLGKAEHAMGAMLAIFLRPSLMIFGLVGAMLLIVVVLQFLILSFGFVMLFITKGVIDPLSFVLFVSIFVYLVISTATKCFALIHMIPHQVMIWIAVHHQPGDRGAEGVEQLQQKVSGAAGHGAQLAEGGVKAGKEAGEKLGQAAEKGASKASGAASAATTGGASTIKPK